ncbi:MAG: trehalose-6-phosphate synthase [Candidatus Brocadiales bacterium]|nr:trehalose-6-phosphate synthase [Candidatus Bathyanammoxibius amoris]
MKTEEELRAFVSSELEDSIHIVVSNREPYTHVFDGDEIRCIETLGGVTIALRPVIKACGGTWVAHGSGTADREVVDRKGRLRVPQENPSFTLRRVWLSKKEEYGYYYGFCNKGLWPLCHTAYVRPTFDREDWEYYKKVNLKFADTILDEIGDRPAQIFIQDYHFALLPRMLRKKRPENMVIIQFWHIPWPNPEAFSICPWRQEILKGLLGNDLIGFQVQGHCNNFLDTIDRELEARVDRERFAVFSGGEQTLVQPFPISLDFEEYSQYARSQGVETEMETLSRRLRLKEKLIGVGVDRIDYTKGIIERLQALDKFLERNPKYHKRFVFIQIGAPSRIHIEAYKRLAANIEDTVAEINWKYQKDTWKPIIYLKEHTVRQTIVALFRLADFCLVSSLHDGMNLVAKEFVATRKDNKGVLILSRFTGAAVELRDALLINPFAIDDVADTIKRALEMSEKEQGRRMRKMRQTVKENNIYNWIGSIIEETSNLGR